MRALLGALAVLGLIAALAAGCGGSTSTTQTTSASSTTEDTGSAQTGAAETSEPEQTSAQPGGIYRIGVEEGFNFTNAFDPTGEYNLDAIGLYSSLLVRTLLGYRHVEGAEGSELVPDLAAALPEVSSDGLTWTLHAQGRCAFGPPVSREITSADVAYAFERIGTPDLAAQYGFYYDVIDGMTEFRDGSATTIAGIETPDDRTIVFHLTEPTGDFGYRLAMPAAGARPRGSRRLLRGGRGLRPKPRVLGPVHDRGKRRGRCHELRDAHSRISGFDPETTLSLVRNPDYDPATDDPEARQSLPDGFLLTVNSNTGDIFAKIAAGELEGEWATAPPKILKQYSQNPDLSDRLQINSADSTAYVSLNLTQPPFDDVHVRRAVNLVADKAGMRLAWGGALTGEIATHIFPDAMLGDRLAGYDPYPSPDFAGDVDAAKAEMAQSRYDGDGDGVCDSEACTAVLNASVPAETPRSSPPCVEQSFAKIGIEVKTREFADPFPLLQNVSRGIPMTQIPTLGQGLRGPVHVRHPVRRAPDHPARQHQLLARRADPREGGEGRRERDGRRDPERRRRHRRLHGPDGGRASRLLGEPRPAADGRGRPVDSVSRQGQHRRAGPGSDAVRVRPVRDLDGLCPRRRRPRGAGRGRLAGVSRRRPRR